MSYVELTSVFKSFGETKVIHGVDLTVEKEEFMVFVGPSGCGKTTLLRLIAGLEQIDGGSITIGDERIDGLPPSQRGIAMVFQNYALYPHMSVYQNMSFGLRLAKAKKEEIDRRVSEAAEILQITELLERKPRALSGGQRQRVAIGRALASDPDFLLLDEPFSAVDAPTRATLTEQLLELESRVSVPTVLVTHDLEEAHALLSLIHI